MTSLTPDATLGGGEFVGILLKMTTAALLVIGPACRRYIMAAVTFVTFHFLHLVMSEHFRRVIIIVTRRAGNQPLIGLLGRRMTLAAGTGFNRFIELVTTGATVSVNFLKIGVGEVLGQHAVIVAVSAFISGIR